MASPRSTSKHALALLTVACLSAACLYAPALAQGFNYNEVGLDWGGLCASGEFQSPINIVRRSAVSIPAPSMQLFFETSPSYVLQNTGNSINMVPKAGTRQQLVYQGHIFNLLQIHAHAVSEHTFDGFFGGLEFHFVHQNASNPTLGAGGVPNSLLVLSVTLPLSSSDTNNTFVTRYLSGAPTSAGSATINTPINLYSLVTSSPPIRGQRRLIRHKFYTYPGSLTVPACQEVVTWMVIDPAAGARVSVKQLEDFWLLIARSTSGNPINNRPPQGLTGRTVSTFYASI